MLVGSLPYFVLLFTLFVKLIPATDGDGYRILDMETHNKQDFKPRAI